MVNWLAKVVLAVLTIVAFVFALITVADNQQVVALHFLNWQTPNLSVFWWLLAAFSAGLLLGLGGITVLTTRLSLKNRKLTRQLGHAEQELHKVRNLTLQD